MLKRTVDASTTAPDSENAARIADAEAVRWTEEALVSGKSIAFGVTPNPPGVLMVWTVSRLLGFAVGGIAYLLVGWIRPDRAADSGALPGGAMPEGWGWFMDLLLTTWQGGGNVPPELGLARRLIERGHRVRVLSEPTVEHDAVAVGCSFTAWPTAPSIAALDRDTAVIKDWQSGNPIGRVRRMGREVLFGPADRFARDVLDMLARHPADGVLADVTQFGALIGAERSGLPVVGLLPSIYLRPTRGHPVMGSGAANSRGPVAAVRDTVGPYLLLRLLRFGLPRVNAVRAQVGLGPIDEVLDLWDRCARLLVMTSPSFDPPPSRLAANVRYVGPIADDPPWARSWTPPWPLGERPFVLVAMSSTYQAHDALLRRVVAALDGMPVHALVTLGPGLRAGEVTGTANVAVAASAPHADLLPEAAVVVTHAGHGSVVKALAAGVPMVCIPHGRDQGDNTARVVAARAGVRLSRRAGADAIRAAVRRVLTDSSYRRNATRLAEAIAREAKQGPDAVTEVEQALHESREGWS